ncbi:hypothetical protein L2E82_13143 [Cichorium intybus]|uniref:Uncharacterized protein n=1 Tax=Cichorium intybus TaxID=13427 RepID=A0ACB9GIN2_CICIN|nr:hypothetical protein L2E82_13143 [Cichorium intybus]
MEESTTEATSLKELIVRSVGAEIISEEILASSAGDLTSLVAGLAAWLGLILVPSFLPHVQNVLRVLVGVQSLEEITKTPTVSRRFNDFLRLLAVELSGGNILSMCNGGGYKFHVAGREEGIYVLIANWE